MFHVKHENLTGFLTQTVEVSTIKPKEETMPTENTLQPSDEVPPERGSFAHGLNLSILPEGELLAAPLEILS